MKISLSVLCFLISTLSFGQVAPPSPVLVNCESPGLGFNSFPASVTISNQTISITKTINTAVYSMSPGSAKCDIITKPGTLLFFPGTGQAGGSITYTFSEPVSNVQIALTSQNGLSGNQLTITALNGNVSADPVLTIFNSSANGCNDMFEVSENVIRAHSGANISATMINVGGSFFTSLTLKNTSSTDTREWVNLRLCNAVLGCIAPDKPTVGIHEPPVSGRSDASFVITNYKASNTYTVTPSKGISQKNRIITAPRGTTYTVKATFGNCASGESSPFALP